MRGKAVQEYEVSQDYSINLPAACTSFDSIPIEVGVCQREILSISSKQLGKDRLLFIPLNVIINVTVHEPVHQCGVSMQVNVKVHLILLKTKNIFFH